MLERIVSFTVNVLLYLITPAFISYNCKALLELKIGAERWCGMGLEKNKRKEAPGFVVINVSMISTLCVPVKFIQTAFVLY